ncbi:phosphodiesterase [Streptomyces sp. NPDC023327]|uniref:phosphodiesterase n=1 Tax=Streptomyces sp. NPDC023327 TaxID=3157088 RepID=UPI0033DC000A
MILDRVARGAAARLARRRAAPALHPHGVRCHGTLEVPGGVLAAGGGWEVPWLDRPGTYPVSVRWSRALGLPGRLPDGFGLAVRVPDPEGLGRGRDAGGPEPSGRGLGAGGSDPSGRGPGAEERGMDLDLLFTSSGPGRLTRHLPLPRVEPLAGPYSTLLSYRVGARERVLALFPAAGGTDPTGELPALRGALARGPVRFDLRAAAPDEPWRTMATLTLHDLRTDAARVSYDPYVNCLPTLHPTRRLRGLRIAAYAGSRAGRGGPRPDPITHRAAHERES